jgi:hypothetical protein
LIKKKRQEVLAERDKNISSKSSFKIEQILMKMMLKLLTDYIYKNHSRQNLLQLKKQLMK